MCIVLCVAPPWHACDGELASCVGYEISFCCDVVVWSVLVVHPRTPRLDGRVLDYPVTGDRELELDPGEAA